MARGKNPEETRRKILAVSKQLFLEKGYDNTSIQDIVNGLPCAVRVLSESK